MPSPILPDGTLLSIPIPSDNAMKYCDLSHNGLCYSELLSQLNDGFNYTNCHLDPDLRKNRAVGEDWVPSFGQSGAALTHLNNNGIKEGDLFLFYGWFRETERSANGKLCFVKNAPDLHVIYGFLQIGQVLDSWEKIKTVYWSPHAEAGRQNDRLNAVFVAAKRLDGTDLPGGGTLRFADSLVLTAEGEPRSHWHLPSCFNNKKITYHSERNYKNGYFQSAARGQEFIIDADGEITKWVYDIIKKTAL